MAFSRTIKPITAVLALAMHTVPAVAQLAPPDIQPFRFDEDYRYLRDPASRQDVWWERLKDMPIDRDGIVRLDVGADLRLRNENYRNNAWGEAPAPNDSYLWYRALPYAALRVGPYIRLFSQFQLSWSSGVQPAPGPTDQTLVDLAQGFAEVTIPVGDTQGILRGGRQLLSYGSERLISIRYGPNVLQPFDAAVGRLEAAGGDWRVDFLYARPVATNQNGSFNDHTDYRRALWGVYGTLLGMPWNAGADLYYLGFLNTNATYEQGTGVETRNTLGLRLFGNAAGGQGSGPDWNFEFIYQFGNFNGMPFGNLRGPIEAWSVASDSGYTFGSLPWRPRIGLRANAISGDVDPNNPTLNSFNAMFPRGKYFGEVGLIGPRNLYNLRPNLQVEPALHWTIAIASDFFWRQSLGDGVYANNGQLIRSAKLPNGNLARGRFIGIQPEIVVSYEPTRELAFEASYAFLTAGNFIKQTGPSRTTHFFAIEARYWF